MLTEAGDDRWFVRRDPESATEALVERFGGGFRLSRWSSGAVDAAGLGVHASAELAETAWWRLVDAERAHGTRTMSARRTGLEDA